MVLEHTGAYRRLHRGKLLILLYHRVLAEPSEEQGFLLPSITTSAAAFEDNMIYLRQHYTMLSFEEFFRLEREQRWDRAKHYAMVTFDDGWVDGHTFAFPVLKRLHIPAAFFICTGVVGTRDSFWWYELLEVLARRRGQPGFDEALATLVGSSVLAVAILQRFQKALYGQRFMLALQQLANLIMEQPSGQVADFIKAWRGGGKPADFESMTLSWPQIREMSEAGMSFGPHTIRHAILPRIAEEDALCEIRDSWQNLLAQEGVHTTPVFSYPSGTFDARTQAMVRDCGLQAALAVDQRANALPLRDPFAISRVNVDRRSSESPALFKLLLARSR
ncbi:MAG: polysaccharide deacetylase family protein [Lentisphaerota bacterium]